MRTIKVFLFLALIGLTAAILGMTAASSQPRNENLVPRTFLLWIPPDTLPEERPNFNRSISLLLFCHNTGAPVTTFTFSDDEGHPPELKGTLWKTNHTELQHVVKGESPLRFQGAWKDDLPPFGAQAESTTIHGRIYRLQRFPSEAQNPSDGGTWRIERNDLEGELVYIGTGLFSK